MAVVQRLLCWLVLFGAVLLGGCRSPLPPAPPTACPDSLRVLFYNVENLHDLEHNGAEYPEFVPSAQGWNEFALQAKLANIATVIGGISADIVGLCEVENVNALNLLKKRLEADGVAYPFSAIADTPYPTSTSPCLLSRLPLAHVRTHGTLKVGAYFSRNILEATLRCGSDSLVVFVTHWPSKLHPESARLAVARILAQRIAQLPGGCDYLLLGDFNADYNEAQLLFTSGHDDTQGEVGINHVLKTVRSTPCEPLHPVDKATMVGARDRYHYDCWFELPPSKRGSYVYRGQWQTPDHVVLGQGLFDSSGWGYRDNSFAVQTHGGALLEQGRPYRWQKWHRKTGVVYPGKGYSDHLPLTLTLERRSVEAPRAHPPRLDTSAVGSFEQGMESWVGMHSGVWLSLDSAGAYEGRYSLRLQGRLGSSHASVARMVVPGCRLTGSERRVEFWVRGGGEWGVRIRPLGTTKWHNYFGPDFKAASQARYRPFHFERWTALGCALPRGGERGFELELRSAKGRDVALWIDAVRIR